MKLHVISFGCQMNLADSEEMSRPLAARGFTATPELDDADAVLVNTCTVRDHAEHRAVSLLGRLEEWKTPDRVLIVAGCAAERLGETIKKRFPHVDLVVGAKSIEQFPELVEEALRGRFGDEHEAFQAEHRPASVNGLLLTGVHPRVANVTVMRGCNYSCSYCIVPHVRGRESYRALDSILEETRAKAEAGAVEVCFVGQTVNSWKSEGKDFADLLRAAAQVPGIRRIRFMSPHPFFMTDRMIQAMADTPQVCPHMHLPIQSGSDRILKAMRRNYTVASFLEKTARLRAAIQNVCLTTDFVIGFPDESETDFVETLEVLERADFDAAYCFKYSPRAGTEAASMPDDVPDEVKQARLSRLLDRVATRAKAKAASMVGRTVEVLLEDPTYGRTEGYYKARLEAACRGPIVRAEVTGVDGAVLRAAPRELAIR